jgi:IclR family transcriptional regulator, pca regulon regulatory protein
MAFLWKVIICDNSRLLLHRSGFFVIKVELKKKLDIGLGTGIKKISHRGILTFKIPDRGMNKTGHIQSVEKSIILLDLLSAENSQLSLEDLTKKSGFPKTVCFRFLQTLRSLGLVEQNPKTKAYQLGPKLVSLGMAALKRLNLRQVALPVLQTLRDETQETVNLAIPSGTDVLFIERIMSDYLVNSNINIGDRLPVHCASLGKAILAFMPEKRSDEIISRLDFNRRTDRTITTASDLKNELSAIRNRGYAVNDEELEKGLRAVAAPILNYDGEAFAAINVAWATARHPSRQSIVDFSKKVIAAADFISGKMGHDSKGMKKWRKE